MDSKTYWAFTDSLVKNLSGDSRVLGLVAVGSMASTHNQPDEWSDHDFLVVTTPGAEEEFRNSTAWLPPYRPIVLNFRETKHGKKVLYDDGHLLEYAFFNAKDFHVVKINSYCILIDRGGFKKLVEEVIGETKVSGERSQSDELLFGQFLTHLLVGCGRHARGERLNGAQFVKQYALENLLGLLTRRIPAEDKSVLDNIVTTRRFERAYPTMGAELNSVLLLETPQAALAMLDLAGRLLPNRLPNYNMAAFSTVHRFIESTFRR